MLFLSGEVSVGVLGCPAVLVAGWVGTARAVRSAFAAEKSAEAVVPVGISGVCREGPNAERRQRTSVLARVAWIAANPVGGLPGRVGG